MNTTTPYFADQIANKLRSVYFSTMHRGVDAAWVIFLLCSEYDIDPVFIKPEHLQTIKQEMKG